MSWSYSSYFSFTMQYWSYKKTSIKKFRSNLEMYEKKAIANNINALCKINGFFRASRLTGSVILYISLLLSN